MTRPVEGPSNPWNERKLEKMNTITGVSLSRSFSQTRTKACPRAGHVEQQVYSDLTFKTQQRSFHVLGYAANPSVLAMTGDVSIVGDVHAAYANDGAFAGDIRITKAAQRAQKRKRKGKGTLGEFEEEDEEEEEEVAGERAAEGEEGAPKKKKEKVQKEYVGPWAGWEGESLEMVAPTQEEWEEQEEGGGAPLNKKARSKVIVDAGKKEVGFGEEKSVFHGAFLVVWCEEGRELMRGPQARSCTTTSADHTSTFLPTSTSTSVLPNPDFRTALCPRSASTLGQGTRRESARSSSSLGAGISCSVRVWIRGSRCVSLVIV